METVFVGLAILIPMCRLIFKNLPSLCRLTLLSRVREHTVIGPTGLDPLVRGLRKVSE